MKTGTIVFKTKRSYSTGDYTFEVVVTRLSRLDGQLEVWYRVQDEAGHYLGKGGYSRAKGYRDGFVLFDGLKVGGRHIADLWVDDAEVRSRIDALMKSAPKENSLPMVIPTRAA